MSLVISLMTISGSLRVCFLSFLFLCHNAAKEFHGTIEGPKEESYV